MRRPNNAGIGRSSAQGTESTGQMWMKTSAPKACCEVHRRRVLPLALDRPSPNPRLQRTRMRAPLSRQPLDDGEGAGRRDR